ncbi:MAG: aminotransferase class I/II-fold pyridoxal phosphate-dependent enzyme [Acidobacteriota bacterium]|nr:aminotransferase class I/II-fold pyridoxal phosphate-dependent enzyme [Acidobacteriota bacterium]
MNNDFTSGLSRRSFMRTLGAASVAATSFPALAALQQAPAAKARMAQGMGGGGDFGGSTDPDVVKISSNENPLGPSAAAREALARVGAEGGRYNQQYKSEVVSTFSQQHGIKIPAAPTMAEMRARQRPQSYVEFYPGSGGALDLAVYSNVGPGKDLVVGEPSYEQGASAGAKMKANVHRVPLTATGAHDVKAMLAAGGPNPGAFYICNPNNPTGTMTPKEDIVWLVNNKPAGSVVIVDEAYHHFSTDESSIDLVNADKDVIVLRTFSKVYGMAGLRGGFLIAKPELQAKVGMIGVAAGTGTGAGAVAISTAAACTASLKDPKLVPERRAINSRIRENVLEWMDKNGYAYMKGSQANFFQADVKRPGREFSTLMLKEKVAIGRTWAAMPNYVRVTIGTQEEMDKFKVAYKKCYETAPLPATAFLDAPVFENPSELYRHLYL